MQSFSRIFLYDTSFNLNKSTRHSFPLRSPTLNLQIDAAIQTASVQLQFRQFRQFN